MKKIKIALNVTAITIAIAGALATRFYLNDNDQPQYIPVNNSFKPAGELGVNYNCHDSTDTCTYYQPDPVGHPLQYLPARQGVYVPTIQ
ncbi:MULTISPECIES: DUF6520 family protein [Niastella]|uniref:Secreted protein n=1 Tax=Niastella soli TaxID=2821487 RepID=A0ABS3YTR6_9BACT|nr:DUF6520 family protein [Niastella soli]MBO9200967.1 hypothetical protein [Niastella soli]